MSSRPRNFRRRSGEDSADEIDDHTTTNGSSKPIANSKPIPKNPPKLLSFADDEDEEEESEFNNPVPKNPRRSSTKTKTKTPSSSRLAKPSSASSSHKITSLKDRVFHSNHTLSSNVQPQAGTYTKEALRELQKNTRTLAAASRPPPEPLVVLRGLVKPPEGHEASRGDNDDKDDDDDDAKEEFPDKAKIAAIKAKRERLRHSRAAASDFISLDGGSNHGEAEGVSDEEPENVARIALLGEKAGGVFESAPAMVREVVGSEEEEDEEEKIWEEEQVRKGLGKNRVDDGVGVAQRESLQPKAVASGSVGVEVGGFGLGMSLMSMAQQGEISKKAVFDHIKRLKESNAKTVSLLNKSDETLSASLINITHREESISAADEKYRVMQKLRDFVSTITYFLQHKAPFIEELEDQMQQLHKKRASTIVERRAADNDDEMTRAEAEVTAAMSVFNRRGGSSDVVTAAKNAAQVASACLTEQANLPVKLDEFGRDMNLQTRIELKGRAEARNRRKAQFDLKRLSSMDVDRSNQRVEGESSTDESDSESTAFNSHRDMLLETAAHIFSDASEEYSQLSVVKETFEEWKRDYLSSYNDVYMSLTTPSIFAPYVRLELLKWDPLHEKTDFLNMNWHTLLMDFGMPEDGSSFAPDDADANLVPELVEKVALPIFHHEVVHCWDMLSTQETKNAVAATSLVTDYVPAHSKALADLLVAIRTRLADAVANLKVPTWTPLVLQAVPNAARVAAYQFGRCVRLMNNICLWKDILSLPILEKLAIDDLLCAKVLPHLWSIAPNIDDAITRTQRIVASLSGIWSGPSATGDRSHKLKPLVDYVMLLGNMLQKKNSLVATESDTSGLARRLKKMLVELNEYDKARDITRTFHLREAL